MMRCSDIFFIAILWGTSHGVSDQNVDLHCTDFQGRPVQQSEEFVPREGDPCMTCTCEDGFPVMCTSVLCSPPDCKFWEAIEGECCRFNCIETPDEAPDGHNATGGVNTKPNAADTTNLGLRLVASTVTSLLILALLLFMIHRLRQRRTLISMRRLNAENQEEEAVAYMTQIDQVDIGIEFPPYEDPPPPYSPPKPPHIPHGEAPPPYEEHPVGENEGDNNNTPNPDTAVTTANGVRPSQGQANTQTSNEQARNGTVSRQNQRNNELSQVNGGNEDLPRTLGQEGGSEQRQSIIARGRVIETLLRSASSSRTSSLPRAQGNKKEKKSTNKRAGENYGLSIALASLGGASGSTEVSPSRMMVSMQNNNPESSLVRFDEEPGTSHSDPVPNSINMQSVVHDMVDVDSAQRDAKHNSLPGKKKAKNCPETWTQFIKKSDSIEIKHGSNSPRNSFLLEDKHFQPDYQSTCLSTSQRVCDNSANSASQSPGVSLSQLGAAAPCVIQPTDIQSRDQIKNSQRPGPSQNDIMSKSASYAEPGSANPLTESTTSLPPMILDLPIREASRNSSAKPISFKEDQNSARKGQSCGQSNDARKKVCEPVCSVFSTSPEGGFGAMQSPSTTSQSPQSPMPVHSTARSGSLESNISIFSVCSETGERKDAVPTGPYTLRNDVQYPLSPFSSLYSAPLPSPISPSADKIPHRPAMSPSDNSTCEAGGSGACGRETHKTNVNPKGCYGPPEPTSSNYPPTTVNGQQGKERQPNGPNRYTGRKVIYMDPEELCENSSSQDSGEQLSKNTSVPKNTNSLGKNKKVNNKGPVKKLATGVLCSAQVGAVPVETKERSTGRKVKQKKQIPAIKSDLPIETPSGKGDGQAEQSGKISPERATSFKQYGFIDSPQVLKSCRERNIYPSTGDQIPARSLAEKVQQRSSSHERVPSRENSKERTYSQRRASRERGKKSRESSKSRSRSGERSRSHGKKSPSTSQRRKRRSRHSDPLGEAPGGEAPGGEADIPSDVAIVNGDLNSIMDRRSHQSRSPHRHKNNGSRLPAVDNTCLSLDDQRNANTATKGDVGSNCVSTTEGNFSHTNSQCNTKAEGVSDPYVGCNNRQSSQNEVVNPILANHSIVVSR